MTKHLAKLMMIPEFITASLFEKHVCTTYDYIMARLGMNCHILVRDLHAHGGRDIYISCVFSPPDMTGYY